TSGGSSSSAGSAGGTGAPGSSAASGVSNGYKGGYTSGAVKLTAGEKSVLGKAANTVYGPVQVQLVVSNHKIVNVGILQQPQGTPHDLQIGQLCFPTLIKETIAAQSGKVDAVSGATYSSGGYIQSLQSAVDKGL
ncbi:MAG: FMN-binding protein, partial [Streptosporangiaceae bacterium]|nr:FMN-binding protein [Streptosporangiaceae bacterium]